MPVMSTLLRWCGAVRCVVVWCMQLMSFPGSDAQADAQGAEGEGGKAEEEEAAAPIGSVFAVLQAYATHVFAPTVRAYAASRGGDEKVTEKYRLVDEVYLRRCRLCLLCVPNRLHQLLPT